MLTEEYFPQGVPHSFARLLDLIAWDLENTNISEGERISVAKEVLQEMLGRFIHCSHREEIELSSTIKGIETIEGVCEVSIYLEKIYVGEVTLTGRTMGEELDRIMLGGTGKGKIVQTGNSIVRKVRTLLHLRK